MLINREILLLPRNLTDAIWGKASNSVLNEGKSAVPLLFNGPEVFPHIPVY